MIRTQVPSTGMEAGLLAAAKAVRAYSCALSPSGHRLQDTCLNCFADSYVVQKIEK